MGMFDSLFVNCPHCSKSNELQSKSDKCLLKRYNRYNAPLTIMGDLLGTHTCCHCNKKYKLIMTHAPKFEVIK